MLHILGIPGHPQYKQYRQWLDLATGEQWDASACNIKEINKRFVLLDNLDMDI